MAIRITYQGKKPADREMHGTCYTCKTRIECVQSDTAAFHDQREGSMYSVKCPTCGMTMYVEFVR